MTNVKLKLMFYVLNALLTADFVRGRPINESNLVIHFTNSTNVDVFNLPIDSNSDTLIVANDEEVDVAKSLSNFKYVVNTEGDNLNAASVRISESRVNISRPIIEEIYNVKTGKEETLLDVVLKSEPQGGDAPHFEFLISLNSSANNTVNSAIVGSDLKNYNDSDVKKINYVELVELDRPRISENKSAYSLANITGHYVENDVAPDTRFTDMQTLLLACFGTLLPLLVILCIAMIVRCICRRWCKRCRRDSVSSVESVCSGKPEGNQPVADVSNVELVNPTDGRGDPAPPNGSIITMTLKNNHLIVETEERNDITKNSRETKMKYSPDNEGIFVVEVQQSAAYRPKLAQPDPQISTNLALIHRVPEEVDKTNQNYAYESQREPSEKNLPYTLSNTGLSISDLSVSSLGSQNPSYSYGQYGYEQGPYGYPIYSGYDLPKDIEIVHDNSREPLICKTPTDPDKPIITTAIFKQDSIIGDALQNPGYLIEGSSDGPLLSDVQAREVSLQQLHEKNLENGVVEVKKALNRADSLPVELEEKDKKPDAMETINEDDVIHDVLMKGKRASLPIIKTDLCDDVTDSPKLDIFNDMPAGDNGPPMITITEEIDSNQLDDES